MGFARNAPPFDMPVAYDQQSGMQFVCTLLRIRTGVPVRILGNKVREEQVQGSLLLGKRSAGSQVARSKHGNSTD